VKDLSQPFGIVSGDNDLAVLYRVHYVLALQHAFSQPRMGQREERVQLRIVAVSFTLGPCHDDAAGADVETDGLCVRFFSVGAHNLSSDLPVPTAPDGISG